MSRAITNTRTLTLSLKREYFEQIRDRTKPHEFRLINPYWAKRIVGRQFDAVVLTLGYPPAGDDSRRLVRAWRGVETRVIQHPHFGPAPVAVYAIDVGGVDLVKF